MEMEICKQQSDIEMRHHLSVMGGRVGVANFFWVNP